MDYQTFQPHPDLASLVKCYWTLEHIKDAGTQKQRIIPDGCLEMIFILGDDIRRYTSGDQFILQPRAMVIGQITDPFYIEPTGYVNIFSIRFYPYGFSNFVATPIHDLANKETAIDLLFSKTTSKELEQDIIRAADTSERICLIEKFLFDALRQKATIDRIVTSTVDTLMASKGSTTIHAALKDDISQRRQLERKFSKQVGMSPKQLGKVIRLQAALKMMLTGHSVNLTEIAYESGYYDQPHFIRDFKEFTGVSPGDFSADGGMTLSSLFYASD